jgi:hypothetical protein
MIISHARRFIFIKTAKTGSTSLELALSKYCGPTDVITPLLPEEEPIRKQIGGIGPQNFEYPITEASAKELVRRFVLRKQDTGKFKEHFSAQMIREKIPRSTWDTYFNFTIVRHPYDRIVSSFYFVRKMVPRLKHRRYHDLDDFDQYIRYRAGDINTNWSFYTENDKSLVDFIVRFEKMEEDLEIVSERIGLQHNLYDDMKNIHTKNSFRPKGSRPEKLLTKRHKAIIDELCSKEMELCGYNREKYKEWMS